MKTYRIRVSAHCVSVTLNECDKQNRIPHEFEFGITSCIDEQPHQVNRYKCLDVENLFMCVCVYGVYYTIANTQNVDK